MIKKLVLPFLVVGAATLGAIALIATAPELEPSSAKPIPLAVNTLEVIPESVRLTVNSQGSVIPGTETDLIPEVAGSVVSGVLIPRLGVALSVLGTGGLWRVFCPGWASSPFRTLYRQLKSMVRDPHSGATRFRRQIQSSGNPGCNDRIPDTTL